MDLRWTRGLPDDQSQSFQNLLRNSSTLLSRLKELLEEELSQITKSESSIQDFEDGNWAVKQAFRNGDRSRIRKVIDLITIDARKG